MAKIDGLFTKSLTILSLILNFPPPLLQLPEKYTTMQGGHWRWGGHGWWESHGVKGDRRVMGEGRPWVTGGHGWQFFPKILIIPCSKLLVQTVSPKNALILKKKVFFWGQIGSIFCWKCFIFEENASILEKLPILPSAERFAYKNSTRVI